MATPDEHKQTFRRFVAEVFNGKNLDFIRETVSDTFVEHQVMPGVPPTKEGQIKAFEMMFGSSPDMSAEVLDLIASGDRVAGRIIVRGTDRGGFMPGMPATNKPYEFESIDIVRFDDDGRPVEHWGIMDAMGVMTQLGLMPPPGQSS